MTVSNLVQKSFASGELSPKIQALFDLQLYQKGLEHCENFIVETQGPARFRTGTRVVNHTRLNKIANFVSFQFNDEQAYMLEFTDLKMRVFRNEGVVLETNTTITGATAANPVVIGNTAHGYTDGDEVFIDSVVGMTELNGKFYLVANKAANTFELTDVDGNNIDGSAFTAYTSGGTSGKVFELDTPYLESQLFDFDHDQNADVLTITHRKHDIRNITRTGHAAWTIATFARTNDPFPSQVITGITQANPGVVTSTAHGFVAGKPVTPQEVVGMTEVNGNTYIVANPAANTFELTDASGANIDTTGFTAYSSAGTVGDYPAAVGYYEGRRFYGGSGALPETFWGSRGPDSSADGVPRYTDHTAGTDGDHAVAFTLAPSFEGTVNKIEWLAGMNSFLAIGTFGGISKATGSGDNEPIAPDSINLKPISDVGSAQISPVPRGAAILYIQRGGKKIRSLEFDALTESFLPVDRNFVADHLTESGLKHMAFQDGEPDVLWSIRTDGKLLLGLTFKTAEDVSGWHRHTIGGTDVKVLAVGSMTLPTSFDQLWVVVERTINSLTRRHVEFFEDEPVIPERIDFVTGDLNKATDDVTFSNAMFEAQKNYVHVDSVISFDGSLAGSSAGATMTPASTSGTSVTFTASAAVFVAGDVGKEIWKKAIVGVGEGRAEITGFTSSTVVTCNIRKDFDNTDAMPAGSWYLTANVLSGFDHLEGETISIIADGAEHPQKTVASGSVTLDFQVSKAHGGLGYAGRLVTLNLENGGLTGPSQTKPRNIEKINARFHNTLRARFGTDFYNLEEMGFRDADSTTNRPAPLFSGIKNVVFDDGWEKEKKVIVEQIHPLPCVVQSLDIFMETSDE